jgi:hypothetical protein
MTKDEEKTCEDFPELEWDWGVEWHGFRWWSCLQFVFYIGLDRPSVGLRLFGVGFHVGKVRLRGSTTAMNAKG